MGFSSNFHSFFVLHNEAKRICATFHSDYSHWNWILNYYLMSFSVLSLGPLLATEKIAIYHNLNLFFDDPRIFLLFFIHCLTFSTSCGANEQLLFIADIQTDGKF